MTSLRLFFNDTATTEIYTLSLHDALPICMVGIEIPDSETMAAKVSTQVPRRTAARMPSGSASSTATTMPPMASSRSEEHTSELQSRQYLVCRLLLEKQDADPVRLGPAAAP